MQTRKCIKCFHSKAVLSVFLIWIFFSIRLFFTDTDDSQDSRGKEETIFYSTLPLPSAHKHWNIYLHVSSLSRIFNRNACVYQTATRWDLPPYRITIWVINWWCNVCLFTWWIDANFFLQRFDIANRWIWTRIDYHPCITNEPTNQVCKCANVWKTPVEEGHFK